MRPFIINLERKIFNYTVENLSKERREQFETLNDYFLKLADLVTGMRAFTVNLGKIVKSTYGKAAIGGAQAAFTTAQNKLDQYSKDSKKLMEEQNKLMIQEQQLVRDRLIVEASQYFKKIKWRNSATFSNDTKLTILLHLVHVGLIKRSFVTKAKRKMPEDPGAISNAFEEKRLIMMAFFANTSVESKKRSLVPNLKF